MLHVIDKAIYILMGSAFTMVIIGFLENVIVIPVDMATQTDAELATVASCSTENSMDDDIDAS